MPVYKYNGKTYDIPEDVVSDFEKDMPGATLAYQVDDKVYDIPVSEKQGFLETYPTASLYAEEPAKPAMSPKEELDAFYQENGTFMDDYEKRDSLDQQDTARNAMVNEGFSFFKPKSRVSDEERTRYKELAAQRKALEKAWYTSDEYLSQQERAAGELAQIQKEITNERKVFSAQNPYREMPAIPAGGVYVPTTGNPAADHEHKMFEIADRIMSETIKLHNAPNKYGSQSGLRNMGVGAKDKVTDPAFLTMGLSKITDDLGVRDVLAKIQEKRGNLNDLSEDAIDGILTPAEKAVLKAWALNAQEQLARQGNLSLGYQAGQSATESLEYMAEFALTGGVGKLASEGVEGMAKWLAKNAYKIGGLADDAAEVAVRELGEKMAKSTVGKYGVGLAKSLAETAGKTMVMPSTYKNIAEKATEIQKDEDGNSYLVEMNDAFAEGYVDSFIENLSEGGRVNAIGELVGDVAGKIPLYKKLVDKFSHTKASELLTMLNSTGVMNTLRAGGWHGFGEEYLEEWYGNALRTITGLDKNALKDFATLDNQMVTLSSFLPMTIFGGSVSTGQVLSAKRDLDKKAEALRSALQERGYTEAQADNMIDMMRGATPSEVSGTLAPIIANVAGRNEDEARVLARPAMEFAWAVSRYNSYGAKYNYQQQEQRDALKADMEQKLGKFWMEDENGRQTVQRGVNEKGEVVYLLGKQEAEDVEGGLSIAKEVAAINSEGKPVFVFPSDLKLENELEMNDFLGNEVMAEKGNKEQARKVQEREAQIAEVKQKVVPGTSVNIGTTEAPVMAEIVQKNPDGVVAVTPDGQARQIGYVELGKYLDVNTDVYSDAELDEQEADALSTDRSQREAALDQEYDNDEDAIDELAEAEQEIEQSIEAVTPLPTKEDGSVDQNALWNNDPERWAQWNDEQRQDGGANSLAYVSGAIAKEQDKIAELQAAYEAESDFDTRDTIEKEIADTQARVERLTAIQQDYIAQAEAQAQSTQQQTAQPVQPAPQLTEEEKAALEEERRKPLRAKAKELSEKLGVKVKIAEDLSDVQESKAREQLLKSAVSNGKQKVAGWYNQATGEVTIFLPHAESVEDVEKTFIHEVVAHKGLRGLLGEEGFNVLCDAVWDMMSESDRNRFINYPGVNGDKRAAADEYMAHFAENLNLEEAKPDMWERIVAIIKQILDSMGVRLRINQEGLSSVIAASYQKLLADAKAAQETIKKEVYNRHTTDKQSAETVGVSQVTEQSGTQPTSSMNTPTSSEDKVSNNNVNSNAEENLNLRVVESTSPLIAAAQQEGESIRFSITTEESLQEKIRNFAKTKEGKATGWTEDDIESIIAETESLIDAIHKSSTGNEFYDEFAYKEPTIRVDWRDGEAKPIVTWTRANIEYKYDMSADLLCINNEGLEQVLSSDKMVALMEMFVPEKKAKKGEPEIKFTSEDYLELYNTLKDLGFVVPCKGCFDAAGRFKMLPSVAQKFAAEVNAVIDERNKDPKAFDDKLKAKSGEKTIDGLPTTASTKSAAIAVGVAGDNLTEHVKWTQLMSADGQTKMLSDWVGIFRAWQRTGAGRPKDKLLPEPYYGDIVSSVSTIIGKYGEKTPSFRDILVNQGTGLRRNSHSEFRPVLAIDEIQFMRDAFIRNLTVFKYMKELDDVRLFGKMGVKFNMSFFPEYVPGTKVAGLDKNGNYIASEESVGSREFPYQGEDGKRHYDGMKGWAEAQKYINKDVSLSSVIFSIPHLLKALTDVPTPSDMRGIWGSLIPFHSSGATTASLAMQGLGMARANGVGHGFIEAFSDYGKGVTNFEAVQNDRFGEGWYIVSGKKAGENVEPGHKLEFANGNHYYNQALGVHLFASGYILDSELPEGALAENGELNITDQQKKALMHNFTIDYNDKVRELKGPYAYKAAADYYISELPKLGLIPRFDFEVSEEKFLEMCEAANVDPRHPKLGWKGEGNSWSPIDSEAYYSLFCDYGMTDPTTGEWAPHMPVGYVNEEGQREFRLPENAVEIVKEGLDRFSEVRRSENARINEAIEKFAERSVEKGRISQKSVDKVLGKKSAPKKSSKSKQSGVIDLVEEAKKVVDNTSDIRFSIIGEMGAMRDKSDEGLARLNNLEVARQMESELNPDWSAKENDSALKIKVATGWERGADGKWRYEVDDVAIKPAKDWLLSKKKLTLRDIVEPNPVFDIYPELLDIAVVKDKSKYNLGAWYAESTKQMKLPVGALKDDYTAMMDYYGEEQKDGNFARYWKIMEEDFLHEIQHAIQHREGFARGGNPDMLLPEDMEAYKKLYDEMSDLIDTYNAIPTRERNMAYAISVRNQAQRAKDGVTSFLRKHKLGEERYKRLAGEVESNNVVKRSKMSDYERYNSLLASTEDVARKDQIFLMDAVAGDAQNNVSFRITPEQDKAYMDAVEAGDMETAQRMVDEAAKLAMPNTKVVDENGNPKIVYHGTGSEFYTFRDTSDSNELGAGYYFSDSYEMAERYATDETLADNRFRAEALAFEIFTDEMGHSEEDYDDNEFIADYNKSYDLAVERLFGNGHVKSVFLNLENPRILSRVSPDFDPTYRYGFNHYNEGVMAKRFNDGVIDEMFTERHEGLTGNQYVAFFPSQIKSAEPVTYDDNGNVIPLSERFNPENEDIRFRVLDTTNAELKEKPIKLNGMYRFNLKNAFKGVKDNGGSYPYIKVQLEEVPEDYSGDKITYNGILEGFAVVRIPKGLITEGEKDNVFFIDPKDIEKELWDVLRATENYYEFKHGGTPYQRDWLNTEGVRFRIANENQAIFVSNAAKAVEGIKMEKATPEQWLKMIEKNGGLKAGEDKWMGLSDWLKASDKKTLTKQEVLDFINENMIQIEEVHYAAGAEDDAENTYAMIERILQEKFGKYIAEYYEQNSGEDDDLYGGDSYEYAMDKLREEMNDKFPYTIERSNSVVYLTFPYEETDDLQEWADKLGIKFVPQNPINSTRLDYTTDGLNNKHEIALTVPTIESWNDRDEVHFGDAGDGRAVAWIRFGDTEVTVERSENTLELQKQYDKAAERFEKASTENFNLSKESDKAWEESGEFSWTDSRMPEEWQERKREVVAELREARMELDRLAMALRNKEGDVVKKVLVIDEIQSKRHQEGREKGYKSKDYWPLRTSYLEKKTVFESLYDEMAAKYGEEFTDAPNEEFAKRVLDAEDYERIMKAKADFDAAADAYIPMRNAIPDAPFDKNWHELAMKRMLRYAAENGYDVIAWTKGDQQADRYNLGKIYNEIEREDNPNIEGRTFSFSGGNYDKVTVNEDGVVLDSTIEEAKGKSLSDLVGKDLAVKVMSLENYDTIDGEDLRIGGEGMKGFYDRMLPAFMNKYGKKWGVKVEDIHLNLENGLDMHSVPVTEEMKASVMEGQVMFRMREEGESAMDFHQSALDDFGTEFNIPAPTTMVDVNDRDAVAVALGYTPEEFTDEQYQYILDGYEMGGSGIFDPETKKIAIFVKESKQKTSQVYNDIFHENTHYLVDKHPELLELGEWLWNNPEPKLRRMVKEKILAAGKMYEGEEFNEMLSGYTGLIMSLGKADVAFEKTPSELKKHWELIFNAFGYGPERNDKIRRRGAGDNTGGVGSIRYRSNVGEQKHNNASQEALSAEERKIIGEYFPEFNKSEDVRFRTSLELDEEFGDAWRNQQNEDGRHSTQVANTKSTYEKIGHYLEDAGMKGASILDASSGLGLGTQALREMGFNVDDVEPFPSENREAPTFSSYADIDGKYDVVISNAVLNVIPDDWRADVLHQMADAVKEGGKMIINTRPASNIAQQGVEGKTRITLDSPSEILVKRGDRIAAYQKGFTSEELAEWIKSELGEGWRVEKATKKNSGISGEGTAVVIKEGDNVSFRTTGTPTDEVVANGLQLTPAQTAEVAANIFAALPEESRKKITEGLNGNILGLKDAILQIHASLASKENWNDEDRAVADVVAEEMTKIAGEMTRPFSAEEGLWLLYNNLNKGTDLISQASRALVQRNLGFDAETLAKQEQAKEDVRFRTVGNASSNAEASLYNRGAVNVWTRLKESFVDMQASVEELVKAIEKRTGKVAQGFENILLALNQQSSKGLAAMESYTQKFLNPMFDEIRRIMDDTKMKYEDIVRYVILKHGLERNKKLAQRDARAHYQEIYDDIIAKINSMDDRQKRTYLTNAQLKEADAKARLATLQAQDTTSLTDEELKAHKKELAKARQEVKEAEEYRERAEKIRNMSEQEAQDELDKIFENIENEMDSVYKEMRENDYSGISSMFYDQLGVDRKKFSTEEQYQAALMEAKKDRYSSLKDIEAAAEAEVASFEGKTDTKELWKRINAATKETLRQQYEANMISKDQYDNLRGMFEYYVPLRGFKDNTAEDMYTYYRKPNSTGYTKPILGAEGRKTEAESPFGWIAAMAGSAIASNVKNEAKLALYYFVSNRPENGIATISRTWFVDSGEVDERGKKIFKPAYPPFSEDLSSDAAKANYEAWQENMRELQKKGQAYEAGQRLNLGNAVVNISDANKPEHIVNVKVGGKDYTIIINGNPRAAQAINGDLNIETNDTYNNVLLGPWLRWLSSVNTSYNPEFWATNMMRDVAFTIMAVSIKGDAAYQRKFFKNYRKAFKVISLAAKNEKGTIGDSYLEEQYKDFVKYGGVTGFTQIKDSETWEKEIENYLKSQNADTTKAIRAVKDGLHAFHRFGESLEQVSRFAAFLTARETGKSINEAINDAKEITVNFNRKGSGKRITIKEAKLLTKNNGQRLNDIEAAIVSGISYLAPIARSTIMFFNASVQALNAWFKLWKANKLRSLSWVIGYAAIGFMNALIHALLDDDDEYLDIPQYERRSSLMLGGNGVYFKWALPKEMSVFYALGELSVEAILGRNPHQSFAAEAAKVIGDVLPVNIAKIILEKGGWVEAMPSQIKAPLELLRNENYKGDVIFNDQKWLSEGERERTANWESAYRGTGRPYIEISRLLNNLTDNKDLDEAGWINIHPESLEHVVESMTGGVGRTVSKLFNFITAAISPEEDVTVKQTPFLNRFLTINDERFKNVYVNDVFDYYKAEAEHALTLEKKYTKKRDMEALVELRGRDEYQWAKIYDNYKKPLKAIQDKIKVADGTAEKKELMKQQDELKKRMIKQISEL